MRKNIGLRRPNTYRRDILVVDGVSGSGKTLILQALKHVNRVEQASFENSIECFCHLYHEGVTSENDTAVMILQRLDIQYYNSRISREVNLRYKDLTGVSSLSRGLRIFKRIFLRDGPSSDSYLAEQPSVQCVAVHHVPEIVSILRDKVDGFHYLRVVRHPCFVFQNNFSFIEQFGTTPRDFTLIKESGDSRYPVFITDGDNYVKMNAFERTATLISDLNEREQQYPVEPGRKSESELVFEKFVTNPSPYLLSFFDRDEGVAFSRALSKLGVPRSNPQFFRTNTVYSRYGQTPARDEDDVKVELNRILDLIRNNCAPAIFQRFRGTCDSYESRHWSP